MLPFEEYFPDIFSGFSASLFCRLFCALALLCLSCVFRVLSPFCSYLSRYFIEVVHDPSCAGGPPPSLPPLPAGQVGKSCKFHLKCLFLGEPKCSKGSDCTMYHQRTVKSCIKADLLAFLAHKCSDDVRYSELCQAIQTKA